MSVDPCPVCSATPRSWVLCHRVGDYICESHCVSCEYLHERLWHCTWKGGPENQVYSIIEMDRLIKELRKHPTIATPEKFSQTQYYNDVFKKINDILIGNKEPRDKLPYYWIRLEAAYRAINGGDEYGRKSEGDL